MCVYVCMYACIHAYMYMENTQQTHARINISQNRICLSSSSVYPITYKSSSLAQ